MDAKRRRRLGGVDSGLVGVAFRDIVIKRYKKAECSIIPQNHNTSLPPEEDSVRCRLGFIE